MQGRKDFTVRFSVTRVTTAAIVLAKCSAPNESPVPAERMNLDTVRTCYLARLLKMHKGPNYANCNDKFPAILDLRMR